jgi:hypothetical protein
MGFSKKLMTHQILRGRKHSDFMGSSNGIESATLADMFARALPMGHQLLQALPICQDFSRGPTPPATLATELVNPNIPDGLDFGLAPDRDILVIATG